MQCNRCTNRNFCITLNATDRSNSIIHIRVLNAIALNADDLNAVTIAVFTSLIRIFQRNHKGAEAGGLEGQGTVGISKDMKVLAAQGDMDGIKAYLDALDTDLNTVDLAVKTGNAMADAIINSKISLAKSRNIPVQIDAHIPVKLKMSELDLCCILGNLFDNAMDASAELPEEERLIRVYMDMKGTQLYISFTNFTATKKQKKLAGRFVTTKGEGHGFGLVRIDAIVEKLDGYLSRNSEDGAFTTEILIPQV